MAKVIASHYSAYPNETVTPLWAYAFRPLFIMIPLYVSLSFVLWTGYFLGGFSLPGISYNMNWHIYEMLFGLGSAGILAFMLTAVPEMFPGAIPVIGKKLKLMVGLWLIGRISFWTMDIVTPYVTGAINIALLIWLIRIVYQPILADKNRRHVSLLMALVALLSIQIGFFISLGGVPQFNATGLLHLATGLYMILILLVLRRVTIEVVNAFLKHQDSDEVYFSRPPRYNLSIFIIMLFSLVELVYPQNSVLGWLGLAAGAAILGILNDFILDDKKILLQPMVSLVIAIYLLMAAGYLWMGLDYLIDDFYAINHFRHLLTAGAFCLAFYLVMVVVSTVHTGREFQSDGWINLGGLILIISAILRALIGFFNEYAIILYASSAALLCLPFLILWVRYYPWLTTARVDGLPG